MHALEWMITKQSRAEQSRAELSRAERSRTVCGLAGESTRVPYSLIYSLTSSWFSSRITRSPTLASGKKKKEENRSPLLLAAMIIGLLLTRGPPRLGLCPSHSDNSLFLSARPQLHRQTHTHTPHTHTPTHSHTHTLTHSHTHTLTHSHSHTHPPAQRLIHTETHPHTLTHSLKHVRYAVIATAGDPPIMASDMPTAGLPGPFGWLTLSGKAGRTSVRLKGLAVPLAGLTDWLLVGKLRRNRREPRHIHSCPPPRASESTRYQP